MGALTELVEILNSDNSNMVLLVLGIFRDFAVDGKNLKEDFLSTNMLVLIFSTLVTARCHKVLVKVFTVGVVCSLLNHKQDQIRFAALRALVELTQARKCHTAYLNFRVKN